MTNRTIDMEVAGKHVTVMGLGRHGGGVAAARYLARRGTQVTVTDTATADDLAPSLAALADVPIARYSLTGHREEDFRTADLVVVNPAVKPGDQYVEVARQSAARITSEIELFLTACPARTIGVTGSNGKSTTAAMLTAMLQSAGRRTWLGGNIGRSLLEKLPDMRAEDDVVLELSSFQLSWMSDNVAAPHVAVVTNCTPNHLDWHGCLPDYVRAKQRILLNQPEDSLALLNLADARLGDWLPLMRGRLIAPLADSELPPLNVPGRHNRENAACAAGVAHALGCADEAIQRGLTVFRGLPHRIEWIADVDRRSFYNDSQATTPESVMAALRSFVRPVWLLAGGHDKGTDFKALADTIVRRAEGAAFYGSARTKLRDAVAAVSPGFKCCVEEHLADALQWCRQSSEPGHVILLSPACASYDQFRDYAQRARTFRELVTAPRRPLAAGCVGST